MSEIKRPYEQCKLLREGSTVDFKANVKLETSIHVYDTCALICRIIQCDINAIVLREGDVLLSGDICVIITKVLENNLVLGMEVWYDGKEPRLEFHSHDDWRASQLREVRKLLYVALTKNPFTDMDAATTERFERDWNALFRIYKFEGYKGMCKQAGDKLVELLMNDLGLQ